MTNREVELAQAVYRAAQALVKAELKADEARKAWEAAKKALHDHPRSDSRP